MKTRGVAKRLNLPLATLFLVSVAAALYLWGPGLLNTRGGGDSPFLLLRTHQLARALEAGHFPVRWMPDAAYGLGYPFFSYYAALPYYVAAILGLLRLDLLSAIKLTQTLFSVAAVLGMYGWARRLLASRPAGWLAAVAYGLAPFHLVNLYVRGDSLSEFSAFAFYPLLLWGLDRLSRRPELDRTLFPALVYAGLILTHNISAFIFSPFALLYLAIAMLRAKKKGRVLALGALTLALGVLLSAWYWLPALAETGYVQLTAQTSGYFFYGNHFRWSDLVQRSFLFDYEIGDRQTPFATGLVQAALAIAGVAAIAAGWIRRRRLEWAGGIALGGLALATWMITPSSRILWDHMPLLPMVQFPWRFLSVQALFAALATAALLRPFRRPRWALAAGLALLLIIAGLGGLQPDYLPIAAEEVTAERLQLYELFTGNVGSTIRYEWLPRAVVPRSWTGPSLFDPQTSSQPRPLQGEILAVEKTVHRPARRVWVVECGQDGAEVAFPLYWWPGWRARVDGQSLETRPAADSGLLTVSLSPGPHTVKLWLGRTPLRAGVEIASLLAVLAVAVWAALALRRAWLSARRRRTQLVVPHIPVLSRLSRFTPLLAFALLLILLPTLSPRISPSRARDLTMDFEQMPWLHHNPGGVDFGPLRLIGYDYSQQHLTPGSDLELTLQWQGEVKGLAAVVRLTSPAVHLQHVPDGWAEVRTPLSVQTALSLPLPAQIPPGLALVTVEVEGPEGPLTPRSPTGRPLGTTFLRPVWVNADEAAPEEAQAELASGLVRLHRLQAAQAATGRLEVNLDWSAARPPVANWGLNLRLTDIAGNEWARLDTQPGYGFLPTGLWPAARLLPDRYVLSLPEGTPPSPSYTLTAGLYRVATWESLGEVTATVPITRPTLRPEAPVLADLGSRLALSDLEVPQRIRQGETLRWTAWWLALNRPQTVVAEWQLEGPAVYSATLPLAPGSDPTTWPPGAWVAGQTALPVPPTAPPGPYTLTLILRDADERVMGTYSHPRKVFVEGRERVWELPPMEQEIGARFGGMIELAGIDQRQEDGVLRLTMHWRALAEPDRHYMLFIHLADPATGHPVAQVDTMPRAFTYPTGMWAAGEVVSHEVKIALADVPPGRYELAVGWYDPQSRDRLEVQGAAGDILPDGRAVLPGLVAVP